MAMLAAIVDLSAQLPSTSSNGSSPALGYGAGIAPSSAPAGHSLPQGVPLGDEYAALAGLCAAAVQRAQAMGERTQQSLRATLCFDASAPDLVCLDWRCSHLGVCV